MENSMQGDLSALRQVMSQQGMGTGVLDQVTSGAPTSKPNVAPTMPLASISGAKPPPMSAAPTAPTGLPSGNPEAAMIVKALGARLTSLSKQEEPPKLGV